MKVVTICLPESYVEGLDKLIDASKYPNRSEVIRIAIRDLLVDELWGERKRSDNLPLVAQIQNLSGIDTPKVHDEAQWWYSSELRFLGCSTHISLTISIIQRIDAVI